MTHADELRRLASDLEDMRCLDIGDETLNLRGAADLIEKLQAALRLLIEAEVIDVWTHTPEVEVAGVDGAWTAIPTGLHYIFEGLTP